MSAYSEFDYCDGKYKGATDQYGKPHGFGKYTCTIGDTDSYLGK